MAKEKELPQDPLIGYSKEGVPVSRNMEEEAATTERSDTTTQNKKRQGTEDAQKRSDTGTGI